MATKSANGGTLLYIRDTINNKLRPDFNVEKKKELELIFIEIHQKTPKNVIIGCIQRHPCMCPKELNYLFLNLSQTELPN